MLENHGLYWNNRDLRTLVSYIKAGIGVKEVAKKLGRTPTACSDRWRSIRIGELFTYGAPEDTLKEYNKKHPWRS